MKLKHLIFVCIVYVLLGMAIITDAIRVLTDVMALQYLYNIVFIFIISPLFVLFLSNYVERNKKADNSWETFFNKLDELKRK